MKKLFSVLFAAVMAGAMVLMTACGGETGDLQKQLDELTQQNEELLQQNERLTDRMDMTRDAIERMQNLFKELRETNAALAEENAELSEQFDRLHNTIFGLIDLDFTKEHFLSSLRVGIRSEYSDIELTAEDFLPVEVVETYQSVSGAYYLTLAQSGDEYLFRSAAKLYQLEFVESVDLVRILSGT